MHAVRVDTLISSLIFINTFLHSLDNNMDRKAVIKNADMSEDMQVLAMIFLSLSHPYCISLDSSCFRSVVPYSR